MVTRASNTNQQPLLFGWDCPHVIYMILLYKQFWFLPLDPVNYNVSLNATRYVAEITVDTPLGTPVIYFGVSINSFAFTNTPVVLLILTAMNDLFKFSNGQNGEEHFPGSTNTDIINIASKILYIRSSPVFPPDTYELTIQVLVVNPLIEVRGRAFVTVNPPAGE